jgi:hypothetical protein
MNRIPVLDFISLYARLLFAFKLYKFVKQNIKNGDIVNVHEWGGLAFFLGLCRKRIKREFKLIITIHGLSSRFYMNLIKYLPFRFLPLKILFTIQMPYFWFIDRTFLVNADHIITISIKTQKFIKKYFKKQYEGTNIINGMDSNTICKVKQNNYPNKALIIGSVTFIKGLDVAIKSIKQFNQNKSKKDQIELNILGFKDFYKYYDINDLSFVNYVGCIDNDKIQPYHQESAEQLLLHLHALLQFQQQYVLP